MVLQFVLSAESLGALDDPDVIVVGARGAILDTGGPAEGTAREGSRSFTMVLYIFAGESAEGGRAVVNERVTGAGSNMHPVLSWTPRHCA